MEKALLTALENIYLKHESGTIWFSQIPSLNKKCATKWTWEAPFRNFITSTGEEGRSPVRNQIDYIATRNQHKCFVTDSRSYGGIRLDTDHKLVKATFKIEWFKIRTYNKKKQKK